MQQDNLIADFRQTVENGRKVSDVLGDGTDEALHSLFERGVFDEVPVIGWFVKACNVASDFQAYRFCKKIYKFVFLTQNYDREELNKFWHEYSSANQENGYELMLSVLNKIDNKNPMVRPQGTGFASHTKSLMNRRVSAILS